MKTIRELINLIETAQNPVDRTVRVLPNVGEIGIDSDASPGNGSWYVKLYDGSYDVVGFNSEAEAWRELSSLQDLDTGNNDEQDIDEDQATAKMGLMSAMGSNDPRNSTQGRERFGEQGVAESTNGWVVYNIRGRIIKNFADEAEARQYAKQYGFYVKPQGVAEALSKTDLLKQVSETYTPTAGELAQDHIKMADGDFNKKYGMSKQQANHYYSSSKLKEPSPREKEAAKWGRKSSVYPFSR